MTSYADLSHHQSVDLAAYFAGHDRVALKVTEGTAFVDPTFAERYRVAVQLGRPVQLYHYDRARFDGAEQADFFLATIRAAGGPRLWPLDLMCLDSEDTNNPAGADVSAGRFTNRLGGLGYPGSAYTGVWFANPYGITASVLHPRWRWLWLSDYTAAHADGSMPLPAGWTRAQVLARQFTDRATVAGVESTCDYSRVLADWLHTAPPPTPPPPPGDTMRIVRTPSGLAYLLQPGSLVGMSADDLAAFEAAGLPSGTATPAQINLMRAKLGGDPSQLELDQIKARLAELAAALGDDEAKILGAVAAMPTATITDAQIEQLSDHLGIDYDKVAAAVRHNLAAALGDDPAVS